MTDAALPSSALGRGRLTVPVQDSINTRRLIAFLAMVFGMFMAILDIQIVSASLAEIQAGLSASADEVAWVQTSYLIAEVIMIPLSGFLSRAFSTRTTFVISCAGFTLMSLLCATATTINEMIVYRALQGFIGGGMIPTVFAASFTVFPPSKRPLIAPIVGLVATLAPTIGPTVGGLLTDAFSWHWLFLVNVLPGLAVSIICWTLIDFDKPELNLLKNFDWLGLLGMALFLGGLEYVLEEGPSKGWFDENVIALCAFASATGAIMFFWRAFTAQQPIVDLSAFIDRNFSTGCFFSLIMGVGLYGLTYLYPVYLARVRGYSALQIGNTMFLSGLCMFLSAPIVGKLSTRVDPRLLIAIGFIGFGLGTWQASYITKDWDFYELLAPQMLRGCSLLLCMVPINNLALGTLTPQRIKNASGLYNLMRNLGGAIGLAMINTVLNERTDLHIQRLHDSVAWGRAAAEERLATITQAMSALGSNADLAALKQLTASVHGQAFVMALGDTFLVLTALFAMLVFMTPLMRKPSGAAVGGGGH